MARTLSKHTYINNWPLQPFSQDYRPSLCVLILYISGGTYSLKWTPNDRFVEKLFMAILFVFDLEILSGSINFGFSIPCLLRRRRRSLMGSVLAYLAQKPRFEPQASHQNQIQKVFPRRLPLSRFLAKF